MNFLDFLFPRRSLLGTEGDWITNDERARLRLFPIRLDSIMLRKKGVQSLDLLVSAGSEQVSPLLKKAIRTFKYGRIPELGPELAGKIVMSLPGLLTLPQFPSKENNSQLSILNSSFEQPVLCPVPLHWTRKFHRGFNQSEILAKEISKRTGYPMIELLKRVRPTGHQAHRRRVERLIAVADAFAFRSENPPPDSVILVDDICSTGATLDNAAKALKKGGVKHVAGVVLAYG